MSLNGSSRKADSWRRDSDRHDWVAHDSHPRDSYQGMPSGMSPLLRHASAFRRWTSEAAVSPESFARMFAAVAFLALSLTWPFSARAQKPAPAKFAADLPAGTMQAKATTACTECHDARIILQQRLGKTAWTKEVDKMIKWGALVDPADRDSLIDYLGTNFSPDKPAYEPQRTSAEKGGSGKASK